MRFLYHTLWHVPSAIGCSQCVRVQCARIIQWKVWVFVRTKCGDVGWESIQCAITYYATLSRSIKHASAHRWPILFMLLFFLSFSRFNCFELKRNLCAECIQSVALHAEDAQRTNKRQRDEEKNASIKRWYTQFGIPYALFVLHCEFIYCAYIL